MSSVKEVRSELRYLVRELGLLDKNCLNSGLSLSQVHLLTYLKKNGQTSFSELCNQLNVEKASLSRTISALGEKGYVEAVRNEKDKRQKYFVLTPQGIDRLNEADTAANNEMSQLLGLLDAEQVRGAIDGLRSLRLSAFRNNAAKNKARIQVEELTSVYRSEIDNLLKDTFAGEQNIPPHLVPIAETTEQKWWLARSGEYVLGAVACWKENEEWHWGRFVVDSRFRGLGIGKALARYSLTEMLQETDTIWIDARDTTVNIIKDLGGEILGERMDFYGMPVTPMQITHHQLNDKIRANGFEMPTLL
ncbi:bifunctional helix-turn-helix transcriptional regulator/GNAT family N-acetyltransferase [uncultured Vibrio sp.]|uniref:helix-turn-helix domain-containing GNAT family N-acetyltransferase n=1 Tax=uncultured Vibrio sp. TaxID=114054 RepID=UPI0025F226A4|nr:bifunctional helix-turn-helix transcriptional regulator/GNAT family N-acetyltransferase [uncultured Vibrio sp.]